MASTDSSRFANYNSRSANPLYHFLYGLRFSLAGWGLLFRTPSLFALSLIPIALTLILLGALAGGVAWAVGRMFAGDPVLFGEPLRQAAQAIAFVAALFAGFLLYVPLARVLLAPFSEALSRKAHAVVYGVALPDARLGWMRAMWEGAKLVTLQLVFAIMVLLLSLFIPIIGPIIGLIAGAIFCGMDYLDVPLSVRSLTMKKKFGVLWRNKSLALGFGAAGYLLLLIPVINLFSIPVGVLGATMITGRIERESNL